MINIIFYTGVLGGLVTVLGAAWPDKKVAPIRSLKNWFLAIGALILLVYALLDFYLATGSIFFVLLEGLVIVASMMMMGNFNDKVDAIVLSIAGLAFVVWSLFLYEGYQTIYFIIGLTGVSMGYAFKMGSVRRSVAFLLGSILLTVFSYIVGNWVFFWLNAFFAIFSGYYLTQDIKKLK